MNWACNKDCSRDGFGLASSGRLIAELSFCWQVSLLSVLTVFPTFVCLLIKSFTWLRHQSTQILMKIAVLPLGGRRVGASCRNWFFSDHGKLCCRFCWRQYSTFVCLLIKSFTWLRHQLTQILMKIALLPLDGCRVGASCRNRVFSDHGKSCGRFCRRCVYYSYAFSRYLEHFLGINQTVIQ